jgi:hypothetical protein
MKVLLASVIFLSSFAFADNHEEDNGLRVGALYQYRMKNDDLKHTGDNAKSVMNHEVSLGMTFKGQFNDDVSYSAMLVPSNQIAGTFSYTCDDTLFTNVVWAHATLNMHEMFSLRVGCMHMNAGGFYGRHRGILNIMEENPAQGMVNPIRRWDKALEFRLKNENIGLVTLQLANDKGSSDIIDVFTSRDNKDSLVFRHNRHAEDAKTGVALHLQWEAKFMDDMLHPLLQFGMYDNLKAMYFSLGFNLDYMGLLFRGDFQMNMHANNNTLKDAKNTATGFNGMLGYNVMDVATPYVAFSMVDVKQDGTDLKGNISTVYTGGTGIGGGQLEDNAQVLSFGLKLQYGDNFNPYLAVDMVSAKMGETETKKDHTVIKLGFTGTI